MFDKYTAHGVFVHRDVECQGYLIGDPLVTELNVSGQAANEAIRRLEQAAVVKERSGRVRGRLFAAEEVIGVLARSFGSDPEIVLEGARRILGASA